MRRIVPLSVIFILICIIFFLKPLKNTEGLNNSNITEKTVESNGKAVNNTDEDMDDKGDDYNTVHMVTLKIIEPAKIGDKYSWEIECEPGQLGYALNALDLYKKDPIKINKLLGEYETGIVFMQDDINIERISNKFNLNIDINSVLKGDIVITINYTMDDISYTSQNDA